LKQQLLTAFASVSLVACSASLNARQIAQLRGATRPDSIDALIAHALAAKGEFREVGDMAYGFTGNNSAIDSLSRMPGALPSLVDCLGWDLRARATYEGHQLLAGVVCFQGIIESEYFQRRNAHDWPDGFADVAFIDFRDPSLQKLRRAQQGWREQLRRQPP
jgi:hypothetical protein